MRKYIQFLWTNYVLDVFLPVRHYLLVLEGDCHPILHGPYANQDERDEAAKKYRKEDDPAMFDGLYMISGRMKVEVDSFSGFFFEKEPFSP